MASLLTRNSSGNVYGFSWLVKHERRADIFKYVKSNSEGEVPDWILSDLHSQTILRDRAIFVNFTKNKMTLRACAKILNVSYETVRQVVKFYKLSPSKLPERMGRNDFRARAREVFTSKVLKDYHEGRKTISEMADLLGPTADTKHADYWIEAIQKLNKQRQEDKESVNRR